MAVSTDSNVDDTTLLVLGNSPAFALAAAYQATAQAMAISAHNSVNAQNQGFIVAQTSAAMGATMLATAGAAAAARRASQA